MFNTVTQQSEHKDHAMAHDHQMLEDNKAAPGRTRYRHGTRMAIRSEDEGVGTGGDGVQPLTYVPLDAAYPPRKRAERLSWVIWAIIGDQKVGVNLLGGSPFQALLEASGTAERLRLARLKLREVKEKLARS